VVRSVLFNTAVSGALSLALVSLLGTLSGSAIAQTPGRAVHATPQLLRASSAFVTPTAALAPVASALALPPASLFTGPAPAGTAPDRVRDDGETPIDYDTPRYEPAGFPIVGGTSDIGVMAGAVFTLTRFDGGVRPYKWNMDLVASASEKPGPNGVEIAQQNYLWQWDVPGLFDGRVRLNPAVSYERTVNQGYFGIGNATPVFPASAQGGNLSRYNEFVAQEARVRQLTRVKLAAAFDLMVATTYRYVAPETYAGSRLVQDAVIQGANGVPLIRGLQPMSLAQLGVGIVYDTRDNEFFPHRGMYHQVGVKLVQGVPVEGDVRYGEAGAILAAFLPVARKVVVASRLLVDAQVGNVPFYDMSRAGPFLAYDVIGGPQGVRGVPVGRYAGLIKAVANVEVRSMFAAFRTFGQSMHVGGDVFFDTGRAFSDYSANAASDGQGVGLKYGAGVGAFLQWGQAAIFRVDVAYSPDAFYVQDGMMF